MSISPLMRAAGKAKNVAQNYGLDINDAQAEIFARAVMIEMLKPSEAMIQAGVDGIDAVEGDCATAEGTAAGFVAMIEAALSEDD